MRYLPSTLRRGAPPRALAGLAAIAAAAAVGIGLSSALFSDVEPSSANTFAAATIDVGLGAETVTCTIDDIVPGDSSLGYGSGSSDLATCVYDITYSGSADAWLAVDVVVDNGTPGLFTGGASGLQLQLTGPNDVSLIDGTSYRSADGSTATLADGTTVSSLLIATEPVAQGDSVQLNLDYLLPLAASNALQAGSSSLTITIHAVQSDNQSLGSCVAGRQCSSVDWG